MKAMKHLVIVIFLAIGAYPAFSQTSPSLEVTVKNIKGKKGSILIGIFKEQDFLKKAVYGKIVKPEGTEVTVIFNDLPAGDYAVSVIHDENGNGTLDTNALGIPKEGFAFGNNAMGNFGPPEFSQAKIALNGPPQIINLKYF
jgi:uncharacterized protein (DUF2141 family)